MTVEPSVAVVTFTVDVVGSDVSTLITAGLTLSILALESFCTVKGISFVTDPSRVEMTTLKFLLYFQLSDVLSQKSKNALKDPFWS